MSQRFTNRTTLGALLVVAGLSLSGCSFSSEVDDDEPPVQEPVENYEPSDAEIEQYQQDVQEQVFGWSCSYAPTTNEDWHDDVLCRLGNQLDRPYLREWDEFVTQDEIMESAAEYEAELNAGR